MFQILTKHQPWTHLESPSKPNLQDVAKSKVVGKYPQLPLKYVNESINVSTNDSNRTAAKSGGGNMEKYALYEKRFVM